MPLEGVLEVDPVSEVRLVSIMGGLGEREGLLECRDIDDGDLEEGKEEREVRRIVLVLRQKV